MYKKYGKHINTNKLQKGNPLKGKPSNQASGLPMRLTKKIKQLTNDIINPKRYSTYLLPSFPTDGSTTSDLRTEPRDNNKDVSNQSGASIGFIVCGGSFTAGTGKLKLTLEDCTTFQRANLQDNSYSTVGSQQILVAPTTG